MCNIQSALKTNVLLTFRTKIIYELQDKSSKQLKNLANLFLSKFTFYSLLFILYVYMLHSRGARWTNISIFEAFMCDFQKLIHKYKTEIYLTVIY